MDEDVRNRDGTEKWGWKKERRLRVLAAFFFLKKEGTFTGFLFLFCITERLQMIHCDFSDICLQVQFFLGQVIHVFITYWMHSL